MYRVYLAMVNVYLKKLLLLLMLMLCHIKSKSRVGSELCLSAVIE